MPPRERGLSHIPGVNGAGIQPPFPSVLGNRSSGVVSSAAATLSKSVTLQVTLPRSFNEIEGCESPTKFASLVLDIP